MTTKEASRKFGLSPETEYERLSRIFAELSTYCKENKVPIITFPQPSLELQKHWHTQYFKNCGVSIKTPDYIIIDHLSVTV